MTPARIKPDGQAIVSVEVMNTGTRTGDEVVQVYIHDVLSNKVTRPVMELKGFRRIHMTPGEQRTLEFTITQDELSFLNEKMERAVEPGVFEILVGTSSTKTQKVELLVSR